MRLLGQSQLNEEAAAPPVGPSEATAVASVLQSARGVAGVAPYFLHTHGNVAEHGVAEAFVKSEPTLGSFTIWMRPDAAA